MWNSLRKIREAKTAPQRVHFLNCLQNRPLCGTVLAPLCDVEPVHKHEYEEKNGPSLPKRSRFPKWLLWGTVLDPLFSECCSALVFSPKSCRLQRHHGSIGQQWKHMKRQSAKTYDYFDLLLQFTRPCYFRQLQD